MRGILVGLLLTAACYAPKVAPGAPCADNGLCPAGQTCSAGVCVLAGALPDAGADGSIDALPGPDRDGDGVADSVDNCPDDNHADQANEDGDGSGDLCDLCPQLVDTVADKDGDHIGDACDPNATADALWLFEGFHGALPGWPASSGWQVVDDAAQVAAPGDPAPDVEDLALPLTHQGRTFDNFSITATVTVTGVSAGPEVAIEYFDDTRGKSIECELTELTGKRVLWLNDELGLDVQVPFAWANGTRYVLRFTRHGANNTCEVLGPNAPAPATGSSTVTPRNGGDFDLWVYGATVRFGSVSVVGPAP